MFIIYLTTFVGRELNSNRRSKEFRNILQRSLSWATWIWSTFISKFSLITRLVLHVYLIQILLLNSVRISCPLSSLFGNPLMCGKVIIVHVPCVFYLFSHIRFWVLFSAPSLQVLQKSITSSIWRCSTIPKRNIYICNYFTVFVICFIKEKAKNSEWKKK